MTARRAIPCALALAAAALLACSAGAASEEVSGVGTVLDLPYASTPGVADAAAASESLAWSLIGVMEGSNRVASPSSLAMNLAMVGEGATGASAASIDAALGLTGDERSRAFGALRQSLKPYESLPDKVDGKFPPARPVVHQAGRVLAVEETISQPFLDRLTTFYDASASQVARGDAKADLDAWVRRNTAGLIERSGVDVTPETRAVLQDAVLFAAAWRQEFLYEPTLPFHGPDGTKDASFVSGPVTAPRVAGDRWEAVRLAYDDALAADVILPAEGVAPQDLTALDLADATSALAAADPVATQVAMPSFDIQATTDLRAGLPQVDLSHLDGILPDGSIEQWVQQIRLQVTAKGTVGAAVTEAAVAGAAPPESPFVVDRPYVFRVLDTRTGWLLFLAVIADPSS
ncbi:MAG: serpin family protein [Arachnia sp.]